MIKIKRIAEYKYRAELSDISPVRSLKFLSVNCLCYICYLLYFWPGLWLSICALFVLIATGYCEDKCSLGRKVDISVEDLDSYIKVYRRNSSVYNLFLLPRVCLSCIPFLMYYIASYEGGFFCYLFAALTLLIQLLGWFMAYTDYKDIKEVFEQLKIDGKIEKYMTEEQWRQRREEEEAIKIGQERAKLAKEQKEKYIKELLGDYSGTPEVVTFKFGASVALYEEAKIIRLYDEYLRYSQISDYVFRREPRSKGGDTYVETSYVPVATTKINNASAFGRAALGSLIGGTKGALFGAASAKRDVVVENRPVYSYKTRMTYYEFYVIEVHVKDYKEPYIRLRIGESREAFTNVCRILDKVIEYNRNNH